VDASASRIQKAHATESAIPKNRYAQKIVMFYCRPCAEYHFKAHPHYRAMKRRAAKRRKTMDARPGI
jgi:hypothetical protein